MEELANCSHLRRIPAKNAGLSPLLTVELAYLIEIRTLFGTTQQNAITSAYGIFLSKSHSAMATVSPSPC